MKNVLSNSPLQSQYLDLYFTYYIFGVSKLTTDKFCCAHKDLFPSGHITTISLTGAHCKAFLTQALPITLDCTLTKEVFLALGNPLSLVGNSLL